MESTQGRLTLEDHFQLTRQWVAQPHDHEFKSHVSRYGDLSFVNESLTSYMLEDTKLTSKVEVSHVHMKVMNPLDSRLESLILAVDDNPQDYKARYTIFRDHLILECLRLGPRVALACPTR